MLRLSLAVLLALSVTAVAADAAPALRYFAYDADSAAARHRSADITLVVRKGMMSSRVVKLYRKRGKDLDLTHPDGAFSGKDLARVIGGDEQDYLDFRLYAVDVKDGEGFAQGACDGADRAWVALNPPRPYQDISIWVLKRDAASTAPVVCETLKYRWRGEWRLPQQGRRTRPRDEGLVGAH